MQLRLLDCRAIRTERGILVVRGATLIQVAVPSAAECFEQLMRLATAPKFATADMLLESIPADSRRSMQITIDSLRSHGLLVAPHDEWCNAIHDVDSASSIYLWDHGLERASIYARLQETSISVFGDNQISRHLLTALGEIGFANRTLVRHSLLDRTDLVPYSDAVSFEDWCLREALPECIVACVDFGGLSLLREWNEICCKAGVLFFPIVLQNYVGYLGPFVRPGRSPCFECLLLRQNSHLYDREARTAEIVAPLTQAVAGSLLPMPRIIADIAALELHKQFSGLSAETSSGVLELNLTYPSLTSRRVLRVPRCPACSISAAQPTSAIEKGV